MLGTGFPVSMYTTKNPIAMWRFNVPQIKELLKFSVKDTFQLNHFICIKDNNFFSVFTYCHQHHERKTICFDIILLSDRHWGTEPPTFTLPFPWGLHITVTYNLSHCRLWYVDVITVIAHSLEVVCLTFQNSRDEKDGSCSALTWFESVEISFIFIIGSCSESSYNTVLCFIAIRRPIYYETDPDRNYYNGEVYERLKY